MHLLKKPASLLSMSLVLALALLTISNVGVNAQTTCSKWASPSGLDTNAGTQAAPYQTPEKLVASLGSGQIGCLRGGSYGTGQVFSVNKSNITLMSAPGERATLYKRTYIPDGANSVTLKNLKLDGTKNPVGSYGYGVPLSVVGDGAEILSNEIVNRNVAAKQGGFCVYLGESSRVIANRTLIQGNTIHGCGIGTNKYRHGLYVNWAHDTQVVGNTIYDVSGKAVQLYRDADRTVVRGNVIDKAGTGVIFGGGGGFATDGALVRNNVITGATDDNTNITEWWESGVGKSNILRDNCLWSTGSIKLRSPSGISSSGNVFRNPLYANASAADYTVTDPTCKTILQAGW